MKNYFLYIDHKLEEGYKIAREARKKNLDPETDTEIPLVHDLAERVEGLISVVAPQIVGKGLPNRIKELEKQYGSLDWRVSLTIALEVAKEEFCKFKDQIQAMEMGIRVGLAYITMGTVASPLEGFVGIKIRKTREGKDYFALFFSGPIRSAGGTGASVSVLIADYVRLKMGYASYDPTTEEVERVVTELYDYHERITNLQYLPSEEEIRFLVQKLPVQLDGDPSEKIEVSRFKGLARIETDTIRNGVCLVLGEGIAQKAEKLQKQLLKWGKDFDLGGWAFLKEFVELKHSIHAKGTSKKDSTAKVLPNYTFINDLVAGRPVLTHPLRSGGFRLRYGRTRTSGYSCAAIHPATMQILNKYIAIGTQLKLERPGKAASVTVADSIEGPIVKLKNGSVIQLNSEANAKENAGEILEILYLGDIMANYGDFFNRNHMLVPPGYCEEWWVLEFEKAIVNLFGTIDMEKAAELADIASFRLESLLKKGEAPSAREAIAVATRLQVPMHPAYTLYWKEITLDQLDALLNTLRKAKIFPESGEAEKIVIPMEDKAKRAMELLGIPHEVASNEFIVIKGEHARVLMATLGLENGMIQSAEGFQGTALEFINTISPFKIRDKSGIFIGARMGRPEKAKMRKMTGKPHMLFPVGDEGGKMRSLQSALQKGKVTADFPIYECDNCKSTTIFAVCEKCQGKTKRCYYCKSCGVLQKDSCQKHGKALSYRETEIDINHYFASATSLLSMKTYPDLIKGVRGTSNEDHTPEHLAKGILRAKHGIYVNKDGTTRYDMTQLPITHFKPNEIGTSVEKLKGLGYEVDCYGRQLQDEEQILELRPQDVILPSSGNSMDEGADEVLFRTANFVDDTLERLYKMKPYYRLKDASGLVGQLVVCLAPHTSAAIAGRIIGFSKTQGFFAHPLLHAATRRDCDGDEACVMLLLDSLINFSKKYLPTHRGSTQDAPLVLTSHVVPEEVDDMVFDMDIAWSYPLEFYEACQDYKNPGEVKIEQVKKRLNTENKFQGYGFTHNVSDINGGVRCSAYKTIPSMEDKLKGQMELAERIRAVDTSDVARLVIEKHFLKDTKGNLRKFSTQQFRCVDCNTKFRRPPLLGKCGCGGRIIFTVAEGSVLKYLEPSISLVKKYQLPAYLNQTLELLKRRIEAVFGKEREKQEGLGRWFA
ncbi:MAG: DNA polymerase II large subunit [Candidatus Woesearchaeota archaeon]